MGVYDTVDVACPACSRPHDLQSKAGACGMFRYSLETAPVEVMLDVAAGGPVACVCGSTLLISGRQVYVVYLIPVTKP